MKTIGIEEQSEDPRDVAEKGVLFDDLGCWQLRVRQDDDVSRREDAALRRWVRFTEHSVNRILEDREAVGLKDRAWKATRSNTNRTELQIVLAESTSKAFAILVVRTLVSLTARSAVGSAIERLKYC